MGPMDGWVILSELKNCVPDIHVVTMTAVPDLNAIKQSYAKGASSFLATISLPPRAPCRARVLPRQREGLASDLRS